MISTNIKKLDEILEGGIRNGVITDIFGGNGTGKTQLILQIIVNALEKGKQILYLDTTGEFRPERIQEILISRGMNSALLDQIIVGRITNVSEQIQYLKKIKEIDNLSLIVIENITDLFSFEYSEEKQFLEKNYSLMKYMHELSLIGIQKQIPILVTNMIREKNNLEIENMDKAISMFTHFKIKLMKNGINFTGMVFSPFIKNHKFSYTITKEGLKDTS